MEEVLKCLGIVFILVLVVAIFIAAMWKMTGIDNYDESNSYHGE